MPFDDDEVEDGTGKSTATVYEQNAVTAAWLTARGFDVFDGLADAAQQKIGRRVTALVDDQARPYFRGGRLDDDQALLFPAVGAYDSRGGLFDAGYVPESYKAGVRLLCEVAADDALLPTAGAAGVKRERDEGGEVEYRDGADLSSIAASHPEAWARIRAALPPPL